MEQVHRLLEAAFEFDPDFGVYHWAAANGQLHTFFESTIRIAGGADNAPGVGQVQKVFDKLNAAGVLLGDEPEFGKNLWGMLHPGRLASWPQRRGRVAVRLLTLTGYIRFLLTLLPG